MRRGREVESFFWDRDGRGSNGDGRRKVLFRERRRNRKTEGGKWKKEKREEAAVVMENKEKGNGKTCKDIVGKKAKDWKKRNGRMAE